MNSLNKLFTDQEVEAVSEKILASTKEKIKDQIGEALYKELSGCLHEHYDNFKDKLKKDLIQEVADEFVSDPSNYQFRNLRLKMFSENKEALTRPLLDEAVQEVLSGILLGRTSKTDLFAWMWNDGIAHFILNHWELFSEDERVKSAFGRTIDNLRTQVSTLRATISDLQETLNEQNQ